jgi:hypothetical protein
MLLCQKSAGLSHKSTEELRMSEGEARKLDSPVMTVSLDDEIARLRSGAQWRPADARRLR